MTYGEGVKTLMEYALNQSGSGAYAAAQVLLSTYNSYNYHMALVDLCNLDEQGYEAAMAVIRGRVEQFREPYLMIKNGQELFDRLEERWASLQTRHRYAEKYKDVEMVCWKCPHCGAEQYDYKEGEFPGRIDGKPRCQYWSEDHPEDEFAIMERKQT